MDVLDLCLCCVVSIVWLSLCGNEHEVFSLLGGCLWCFVLERGGLLLSCVCCEDGTFYGWSVLESGVSLCSEVVCFLSCVYVCICWGYLWYGQEGRLCIVFWEAGLVWDVCCVR